MTRPLIAPSPGAAVRHRRTPPASLVIGLALIGLVLAAAGISFVWTPFDATLTGPDRLLGPGTQHVLGTDSLGRDILSQLLVGARTTVLVGVISVGVAAVIGVPLGVLAATGPRWLDEVLMRVTDVVLAFPALLLAIVFAAVWGASTVSAMVAIGIATAPAFARLSYTGTRQVLATDFVAAARLARRSTAGIVVTHVLPNISGTLTVQASVSFAVAVLAESGLSYLGFGAPPPTPTWGRMLQEAQSVLFVSPLQALWPSVAIVVAVLGFTLLGDGLRDRFDPRQVVRDDR